MLMIECLTDNKSFAESIGCEPWCPPDYGVDCWPECDPHDDGRDY